MRKQRDVAVDLRRTRAMTRSTRAPTSAAVHHRDNRRPTATNLDAPRGCRPSYDPRSRRSPTPSGRRNPRRSRNRRVRRYAGLAATVTSTRARSAGKRPCTQRRGLTLGRERQVGAAGVATVPAPLGLAVPDQPDLLRHLPAAARGSAGSARSSSCRARAASPVAVSSGAIRCAPAPCPARHPTGRSC